MAHDSFVVLKISYLKAFLMTTAEFQKNNYIVLGIVNYEYLHSKNKKPNYKDFKKSIQKYAFWHLSSRDEIRRAVVRCGSLTYDVITVIFIYFYL